MTETKLPPIVVTGVAQMALIVVGAIYMVSHLPESVPLTFPTILLAASAVILVGNMIALARTRDFAWKRFFTVAKWVLVAYTISAALIEYVFLHNGTRGGPLVVLTLSLVVYALTVPMMVGFTVAKYVPSSD